MVLRGFSSQVHQAEDGAALQNASATGIDSPATDNHTAYWTTIPARRTALQVSAATMNNVKFNDSGIAGVLRCALSLM